jgi:hypothetical protein
VLSSIAVSVTAQQKLHDTKAHVSRQQVIDEAVKSFVDKFNKVKAELEQCRKNGKTCSILNELVKKFKALETTIREKKAAIVLKIDSAQARGTVQYYKQAVKSAPKQDAAKVKIFRHDLRVALRDQERVRLRQDKVLAKKLRKEQKRMKRQAKKVRKCQRHPRRRGCKRVMRLYGKEKARAIQLKKQKRNVEKKIARTRQNHVRTFRKVKSVEAKKAIILNRYNVKINYVEKKIQKLEKRLRRLSKRRRTRRVVRKYRRTQRKIRSLRRRLVTIKKQEKKTIVLKSTGPGSCNTCENSVHSILNEIHINLVFRSKSGKITPIKFKTVKRTRKVQRTRMVRKTHHGFREVEKTGKRRVMRTHRTKKLRTWYTNAKIRTYQPTWRNEQEKYLHKVTTNQTVRVFSHIQEYKPRRVLRKWFTMEKRKVPVVVKADGQTRLVKKTFTRTKRVLKTLHRKIVKQVPYELKKWVTKKVLVMKKKMFRRQSLEYQKNADGTGYYHWVDQGIDTKMVPTWVDNKVLETEKKVKNVTMDQAYQQWENVPETYTTEVRVPVPGTHVKTIMVEKPVKVWHQKWVMENVMGGNRVYKNVVVPRHHYVVRTRNVRRRHYVARDQIVRRKHTKMEDHVEQRPEEESYKYKVRVPHKTHRMVQEKYEDTEHYTERVPVRP